MLRSALSRHIRTSPKPIRRHFHVSISRNAVSANDGSMHLSNMVLEFGSKAAPAFHNLFPLIHDFTSLPWLISIPVTTILLRSLVTPVRCYLALFRRDQQLAEPKLKLAATIIKKQGKRRLATGVEFIEENHKWMEKEWESRREGILKEHPRAEPIPLIRPRTNLDIANLGAIGLVAINTSTLLAQSLQIPELINFEHLKGFEVVLSTCFFSLAVLNSMYYQGKPYLQSNQVQHVRYSVADILKWTEQDTRTVVVVGLPFVAGIILSCCPEPVILSVVTNSTYTLLERTLISKFIAVPYRDTFTGPRSALQSTITRKPRGLRQVQKGTE